AQALTFHPLQGPSVSPSNVDRACTSLHTVERSKKSPGHHGRVRAGLLRCAQAGADARLPGVSDLLIGLLSAALATNQAAAVSNLVQQKTGLAVTVPDRNDPVEREYQKLLEMDDTAQEEVDEWLKNQQNEAKKGAPVI